VIDPTTNGRKRITVPVILGLKSHMDKAEAREILDYQLFRQSGAIYREGVWTDGSVTFGWFVRNRFFPLKEAMWKVETAKIKKLLIESDLIDIFDVVPLKSFDKFRLQIHLNNLAKEIQGSSTSNSSISARYLCGSGGAGIHCQGSCTQASSSHTTTRSR
jgi:hypothetical protein